MNKRVLLKIHGRVQMVLYRDSARRTAEKLGLTGWVRNEPGGTVAVAAEGPEEKLNKFIAWCRRGPLLARVSRVDVQWEEAAGQFKKFDIQY